MYFYLADTSRRSGTSRERPNMGGIVVDGNDSGRKGESGGGREKGRRRGQREMGSE